MGDAGLQDFAFWLGVSGEKKRFVDMRRAMVRAGDTVHYLENLRALYADPHLEDYPGFKELAAEEAVEFGETRSAVLTCRLRAAIRPIHSRRCPAWIDRSFAAQYSETTRRLSRSFVRASRGHEWTTPRTSLRNDGRRPERSFGSRVGGDERPGFVRTWNRSTEANSIQTVIVVPPCRFSSAPTKRFKP